MLVEGYSDQLFLIAALRSLGLYSPQNEDDFYIKIVGGKETLCSRIFLENELKPNEIGDKSTVSFFVDGDDNPQGAFQSLHDQLKNLEIINPSEATWTNDSPRYGIFVFPDLKTQGELETLIWNAMPDETKFKAMKVSVETHLSTMTGLGWPWKSEFKAKMNAYLASAWDEDPRVGPATSHRKPNQPVTIDFSWPGFTRLLEFLRQIAPTSSV